MSRNPIDEALAKLCEATCEAVEELEAESDFFDGCPLCGKPSYVHPREQKREGEQP